MYKIIGADQKEYGPVSVDQVREWIIEGRANGQTKILSEGGTEWKPVAAFPEFADALRAAPIPRFDSTPAALPTMPSGTPADANTLTAQAMAGEPDFDIWECLGRSGELLMKNFGLLVGASFAIWLSESVLMFIPYVGAIGFVLLHGVFLGGLYLVYLKRIRGETATIGDAFSGFTGSSFPHLLLTGVLVGLLSWLGMACCLILPGIYLLVAWVLALPLVADKQLEFWTAMELSRKVVTRVWFKLFALLIIVYSPVILFQIYQSVKMFDILYPIIQAGMNQSGGHPDMEALSRTLETDTMKLGALGRIAYLICLPFAIGAITHAYEAIFRPRTTPTA